MLKVSLYFIVLASLSLNESDSLLQPDRFWHISFLSKSLSVFRPTKMSLQNLNFIMWVHGILVKTFIIPMRLLS